MTSRASCDQSFSGVLHRLQLITVSGVVCNFGRVCLYECTYTILSNSLTLKVHLRTSGILEGRREYELSSYMKVIGSRSGSQEQKGRMFIGNNFCFMKHRAMKFACSIYGVIRYG